MATHSSWCTSLKPSTQHALPWHPLAPPDICLEPWLLISHCFSSILRHTVCPERTAVFLTFCQLPDSLLASPTPSSVIFHSPHKLTTPHPPYFHPTPVCSWASPAWATDTNPAEASMDSPGTGQAEAMGVTWLDTERMEVTDPKRHRLSEKEKLTRDSQTILGPVKEVGERWELNVHSN